MLSKEILATIHLAHHFQSAFTPEQVYLFLRTPAKREEYQRTLQELLSAGQVKQVQGALFARDMFRSYQARQEWSRAHFRKHRRALKLLVHFPWVRFAALTGANAFESCAEQDDIDLFIITRKDRLWVTYVLMVLFTKLIGKRPLFCLNYLIDEDHLRISRQDYYTAVQIVQLLPLLDSIYGEKFRKANRWICRYLPNAGQAIETDPRYLLRSAPGRQNGQNSGRFWKWLNNRVFQIYQRRLQQRFPEAMDRGISISPGMAQLNRIDHHDMYRQIYAQIDRELNNEVAVL